MDKLQLFRTALDALYFLLKNLPEGFLGDSTKVVLQKIVTDVFTEFRALYEEK